MGVREVVRVVRGPHGRSVVATPLIERSELQPARRLARRLAALAEREPARTAALSAVVASFIVYALTALRGVSFADWAEAQTVPSVLGIFHPTGYPFYTLVGKLASLVPIGSVALRANLLSGLCTSLALGTAVLVMTRLGIRPVIAAAAALTVGFLPIVWVNSTRAEVHTLHLLFVAVLLHRLLVWHESQRLRDLYLGALLLGLSFGNHLLTVTVAPFIVLGALWLGRQTIRLRARGLVIAGLAFLAGLSVYLYLPLRSLQRPPAMYADLSKLDALAAHVTGQEFRSKMAFLSLDGPPHFIQGIAAWLALPDIWPVLLVLALALLGALLLLRRSRAFGLVTVALVVLNVYVDLNYEPTQRDQYLFTSLLLVTIWLAVLAQAAVLRLPARWRWGAAAFLLLPLGLLVTNWAAVDQSGNRDGERFVEAIFSRLPPNAVLYSFWDSATPLNYERLIEGQRTDVTVVTSLSSTLSAVAAGRPVFTLQMFDSKNKPLRDLYTLTEVAIINVAYGGVVAPHPRPLFRVEPLATLPGGSLLDPTAESVSRTRLR